MRSLAEEYARMLRGGCESDAPAGAAALARTQAEVWGAQGEHALLPAGAPALPLGRAPGGALVFQLGASPQPSGEGGANGKLAISVIERNLNNAIKYGPPPSPRWREVGATNACAGHVNAVAALPGAAMAAACVEDVRAYNRPGELVHVRVRGAAPVATVLDGHCAGGLRRTAADVLALNGCFVSAGFDGAVSVWGYGGADTESRVSLVSRTVLRDTAPALCVASNGDSLVAAGTRSGTLHVMRMGDDGGMSPAVLRQQLVPNAVLSRCVGSVDAVRVAENDVYALVGASSAAGAGRIYRVSVSESSLSRAVIVASSPHGLSAMDHSDAAGLVAAASGSVTDDERPGDGQLVLLDARCGRVHAVPTGLLDVEAVCFCPGGRLVACADASAQRVVVHDLRRAEYHRPLAVLDLPQCADGASDRTVAAAWLSPDVLAYGGAAGAVSLWDAAGRASTAPAVRVGPPITCIASHSEIVYVGTSSSTVHVLSPYLARVSIDTQYAV